MESKFFPTLLNSFLILDVKKLKLWAKKERNRNWRASFKKKPLVRFLAVSVVPITVNMMKRFFLLHTFLKKDGEQLKKMFTVPNV